MSDLEKYLDQCKEVYEIHILNEAQTEAVRIEAIKNWMKLNGVPDAMIEIANIYSQKWGSEELWAISFETEEMAFTSTRVIIDNGSVRPFCMSDPSNGDLRLSVNGERFDFVTFSDFPTAFGAARYFKLIELSNGGKPAPF